MKTYLISQEQIKQFVVLLVVAILAVFFAGYYLGGLGAKPSLGVKLPAEIESIDKTAVKANNPVGAQIDIGEMGLGGDQKTQNSQTASTHDGSKAEQKVLAGKKQAEQEKAEKKKAEKKAEKKKAEKKKAEKKKAEKEKVAKLKAAKERAERKKAEKAKAKAKAKQAEKAKDQAAQRQRVSRNGTGQSDMGQSDAGQKAASTRPVKSAGAEPKITSLQPGRRYYSIQAGMFASKVNASSFIRKLAENNFIGYVSDFVSTSGAVKYNVRVGRFEQRNQARALLREFQKAFSSPAYVVITDNRSD